MLDYNAINAAGGIAETTFPFLNTTSDRNRLRERARLGVQASLDPQWTAGFRLASGSLTVPPSESQNQGTYSNRYTVGFDEAYLRWDSKPPGQISWMSIEGGRFLNPWFSPTELVWARDLTFEGVAGSWRLPFGSGNGVDRSLVYLSFGADQMLEVPLANEDNKWMLAGQLGANLRLADGQQHLRFAAAYYDYLHITGIKNPPLSTYYNFTAPAYIQYGNSYYDISNTPNPNVNLFALAAQFRLIDLAATYELSFGSHLFTVNAEAVRNIGYNLASVQALTGQIMPRPENVGYEGELGYGYPEVNGRWDWRARIGYKYVRRDAVLDAWTDADFHGGGTNAEGYFLWYELGLAHNVWMRVRYLSGNEVDGPRFGLDTVQTDFNARF
jgi:Putative porin